ncbi:MAG: hypothetical protein FWD73_12970 [Polyangiaceae bacterium]|nr:hypothetical protein [Polyangiaceae bacterium]
MKIFSRTALNLLGALGALGIVSVFGSVATGCGASTPPSNAPTSVDKADKADKLRAAAHGSSDGEELGQWLLGEMFAPGGSAENAAGARASLDKAKSKGLYASLGAGVFDETHGQPKRAAEGYVATLSAAKRSDDPVAPLAAFFATHHLIALSGSVANLWAQTKPAILPILDAPGHVGWRALAELHEWSTAEALDRAEVTSDRYDDLITSRMGCARNLRMAGPFGRAAAPDRRRSFGAERSPWPPSWPEDPVRGSVPHVLKAERRRCVLASTEHTDDGIYYVETFFDTPSDRDVLIAVQGSVAVWVDDALASERDLRNWGAWQRFGSAVHVKRGRHRVLARVLNDAASIRLLNLDGTSANLTTDTNDAKPYSLARPTLLADPNPIARYVEALAVDAEKVTTTMSPLALTLAAYAASIDGLSDVAATMTAPLTSAKNAAPVALLFGGRYAHFDGAYPEQVQHTNEKDLYARAAVADPKLWYARGWLILDDAEQRGLVEAVDSLRTLTQQTPDVPDIAVQLARLYGRLGWRAERMRTIKDLAEHFPDDRDVLALYMNSLDDDGSIAEADKVAERIKRLDPDSEIDLDRAIARHDWKAAIEELKRLEKRRPDRKELAARIADMFMRSGDPSKAAMALEKALEKNPQDSATRLRLADYAYAKGDTTALRRALARALQAGSKGNEIREAIDLIEGASLLEPYRMDGRRVIKEFEAWERSGKRMDGTAARVLDYAATWVHPDGSSEMLEHEIIRMQSQEAIGQEAEQEPPTGQTLRLRVIKPDGSMLEPENVAGKATLTMPHLEVGDYIEIEHITPTASDGSRGKRYVGPQWFFREADKGYWRSEFVVVTPKDKALDIETIGRVPAPKRSDRVMFVELRWRVDESPPAPDEPDSPNPREFLPSVRIGWGVSLDETLLRFVDAASPETPLDPRLRKKAREIVAKIPASHRDDQARALYKYTQTEIQESNELDARRAINGRSGSRSSAFSYLAQLLGIPVELALVKSRIAMPPRSKMSAIDVYDNIVTRIETEKGPRWLTMRDKFAPYGYIPAELRGQPAIRLVSGTPRDVTPALGAADGVLLEGKAVLAEDGSATMDLVQSFSGRMGIRLREIFDQVPQNKHRELVETQLLGPNIPGARLKDMKLENVDDLGAPLALRMHAEVPEMARVMGPNKLALKALFPVNIAQIASLAERQTPLLLGTSSHVEVKFEVLIPSSIAMPAALPTGELKNEDRTVRVADAVTGHSVILQRVIDIPAGRVQPGAQYTKFSAFTRAADELLARELTFGR